LANQQKRGHRDRPYTLQGAIVSALVELHYLNDESASPPAVGVAIGEANAALLAEKILQMRLRRSTNSRR
jgi:hypothetical protein